MVPTYPPHNSCELTDTDTVDTFDPSHDVKLTWEVFRTQP